jgi:hypothetical protein
MRYKRQEWCSYVKVKGVVLVPGFRNNDVVDDSDDYENGMMTMTMILQRL